MLCLSRKVGESLEINVPPCEGGKIKIFFVSQRGPNTRIGIEAPVEFQILRDDAKVKERNGNNANR